VAHLDQHLTRGLLEALCTVRDYLAPSGET